MKICGLDECGRGAFAGPLVAAAVIINHDLETFPSLLPAPLRDSKKLTEIQRDKIFAVRAKLPISYKIEEISVADINERGMGWANKEIFERLVGKMKAKVYMIDGNLRFANLNIQSLVKGDDKCYPVMLASILAKVYRDKLLKKMHCDYPAYLWDKNSGYGTKEHLNTIREIGTTTFHRSKYVETYLTHFPIIDLDG